MNGNFGNTTTQTSRPKLDEKISPAIICSVLTIIMIIAALWGFHVKSALVIAIFLLPVAAYEIYRTRGASTTLSSWVILAALIAEIIFIVFKINFDLGKFLNLEYTYMSGQIVPIGDIKILGPILLFIFSVILLLRTAGPYTKWLSVIIIVSAFTMVYILNPEIFRQLLGGAFSRLFWYF